MLFWRHTQSPFQIQAKKRALMSKKPTNQPGAILHRDLPIVEVAEAWLLDTILADASAARCVVTRLSDRVAVVAPGEIDALLARLRKLGHTPKVLAE
jgi:hypothetical protein